MGPVQTRVALSRFAANDWQVRWSRLVAHIRVVGSAAEEARLIQELLDSRMPRVLAFVNAHAMNCAAVEAGFFDALVDADVLGHGLIDFVKGRLVEVVARAQCCAGRCVSSFVLQCCHDSP